jgi:protein-disulfide isomerase
MKRITVLFAILLALVTFSVAQGKAPASKAPGTKPTAVPAKAEADTAASSSLPTKETVESFMKHMFGYDPSATYEVLDVRPSRAPGIGEALVSLKTPQGQQTGVFYIMPGGKFAIIGGEMMPFGADPFAPARAEIAARANGPIRGPANAAVTVVEFSDLECPACKGAQPTVDRLIADEPDVKFIFQNFPLEKLHPWAFMAATYADCVGRQNNDAFWDFIANVYKNQEAITALLPSNTTSAADAMKQASPAIAKKLQELVAATPANSDKVAACAAEQATAERVRQSIALGDDLDVTGTPTLYVNGRRIANVTGIPYESLKSIVDAEKAPKK